MTPTKFKVLVLVLVFGAALILPSLLVWACLGFIEWNWSPSEWTAAMRAGGVWFSLGLTVAGVGVAASVVYAGSVA